MILNISVKKFCNLSALIVVFVFACCSNTKEEKKDVHTTIKSVEREAVKNVNQDTIRKKKDFKKDSSNNEREFRDALRNFKQAILSNKVDDLKNMMNFPFYTSNEDGAEGKGAANDPVQANEFIKYKTAIYNSDVVRLLPLAKDNNLSEIENMEEAYYKSLKKITDPGSIMYEVYMQYPEAGTNAENYFGFVLGRVKGEYKAIASYSKWSVK